MNGWLHKTCSGKTGASAVSNTRLQSSSMIQKQKKSENCHAQRHQCELGICAAIVRKGEKTEYDAIYLYVVKIDGGIYFSLIQILRPLLMLLYIKVFL